jgi:hypothetical protein
MSVSTTHYVVKGVMFTGKKCLDQVYDLINAHIEGGADDKYYDNESDDGLCLIPDGMSGKYFFVGKVLAEGSETDGFDEVIELPNVDPAADFELATKIRDAFGITGPIKTYVFTHWS